MLTLPPRPPTPAPLLATLSLTPYSVDTDYYSAKPPKTTYAVAGFTGEVEGGINGVDGDLFGVWQPVLSVSWREWGGE